MKAIIVRDTNAKEYINILKNDFEIIFDANRPGKSCREIDEMFFIFLSNFEFYMKNGDYMEAHNSMTDLFCYNTNEKRAKYLIECAIAPYKRI